MIYWFQTLSLKVRFLAVVLLLFPVLLLRWLLGDAPWALASLKSLSRGVGLPSPLLWNDPASYTALVNAWGTDGGTLYVTVLAPLQAGLLVALGGLLVASLLYLLKKGNPARPWWYLLPLVPAAGAGFGLLEQLAVLLLTLFPRLDPLGWVAAVGAACRWVLLAAAAAALAAGTAGLLFSGAWKKLKAVMDRW